MDLRGALPWLVVRPRPTRSTFRQTLPPHHPPLCPDPDRPAKQAQKKTSLWVMWNTIYLFYFFKHVTNTLLIMCNIGQKLIFQQIRFDFSHFWIYVCIHIHVYVHDFGFELDLVEIEYLLKMINKQPKVVCLQLKIVNNLPGVWRPPSFESIWHQKFLEPEWQDARFCPAFHTRYQWRTLRPDYQCLPPLQPGALERQQTACWLAPSESRQTAAPDWPCEHKYTSGPQLQWPISSPQGLGILSSPRPL